MPMTNMNRRHASPWLLLPALAALGCGGDLTLPSSPGGSSGEGVQLSIEDGNEQVGTVGQELPKPLIVKVESDGAPIQGQQVAFVMTNPETAGRLDPDTAVTGSDGLAITHWVLGTSPGPHAVEARLVVSEPSPPPSALFEASAVAGPPDTARALSPLAQPGRKEQPAPQDPLIIVLDRFGNPVDGAAVAWEVTAGGGSASGQTLTDQEGRATVTWLLGTGIGVQKLSAVVEGANGSPVRFSAVVLF